MEDTSTKNTYHASESLSKNVHGNGSQTYHQVYNPNCKEYHERATSSVPSIGEETGKECENSLHKVDGDKGLVRVSWMAVNHISKAGGTSEPNRRRMQTHENNGNSKRRSLRYADAKSNESYRGEDRSRNHQCQTEFRLVDTIVAPRHEPGDPVSDKSRERIGDESHNEQWNIGETNLSWVKVIGRGAKDVDREDAESDQPCHK